MQDILFAQSTEAVWLRFLPRPTATARGAAIGSAPAPAEAPSVKHGRPLITTDCVNTHQG